MSKKKLTRLERLLFLTPLLVVVVLWLLPTSRRNWPEYLRLGYSREKARRSSCQSNLKQIQMSVSQYLTDYDGRFPPVKGKPSAKGIRTLAFSPKDRSFSPEKNFFSGDSAGWADSLQIYAKSVSLYMCPAEHNKVINPGVLPTLTAYTDYWFNANLSTLPKAKLAKPTATFLVGEGNDGKDVSDAAYGKTSIPPTWLSDSNSPAFRHLGGANYLMADGSVHWLKPDQLAAFGAGKDLFAIK